MTSQGRRTSAAGMSHASGVGSIRGMRQGQASGLFSGISSPSSSSMESQIPFEESTAVRDADALETSAGGNTSRGGELQSSEPSFRQTIPHVAHPIRDTASQMFTPSLTSLPHGVHPVSSTPLFQAISWRHAADRATSEAEAEAEATLEGDFGLLAEESSRWGWAMGPQVTNPLFDPVLHGPSLEDDYFATGCGQGHSPNLYPHQLPFAPIDGSGSQMSSGAAALGRSDLMNMEAMVEHQSRLLQAYEQHLRDLEARGGGAEYSHHQPQPVRRVSATQYQPVPWRPSRLHSVSLSGSGAAMAAGSGATSGPQSGPGHPTVEASGRRRSLARSG